MSSSDWQQTLTDCLSGHQQTVLLFEQDDEVNVQCDEQRVVLRAQLTPADLEFPLQSWCLLGQSSLAHFQGALALAPATGHLWLVQCLPGQCSQKHLLKSLEVLLNQRDTWRSVTARLRKAGRKFQPTSLRQLPH